LPTVAEKTTTPFAKEREGGTTRRVREDNNDSTGGRGIRQARSEERGNLWIQDITPSSPPSP